MAIKDSVNKLQPNINTPSVEGVKNIASSAQSRVTSTVDEASAKVEGIDIDSISAKEVIKILVPLAKTALINIATSENTVNLAIKESTALLNRKGRVEIIGTTVNFYPAVDGPWLEIKAQFDRKIQSITKSIDNITRILNILTKTLSVINTVLVALQIFLRLRETILNLKLIAAATDLSSPAPSKPVTAQTIATISDQIKKNQKMQDIIDEVKDAISVINTLLLTINTLLSKLKLLLSQAKLNIIINKSDYTDTKEELLKSFDSTEVPLTLEETITGSNGIRYTIKIIPLKDGFNKAVAYDTLSGVLITQTAPSIIKTPLELINELKQILS